VRERQKNKTFLSSPAARSGEEERGTMSFKTTPFWYCFFFFNMKRRRFGKNTPFHLNKTRRQNASNFKSALNYLLFISIASLSISVSAPMRQISNQPSIIFLLANINATVVIYIPLLNLQVTNVSHLS